MMNHTSVSDSLAPIPQGVTVTLLVLTAVFLVTGTYGNAKVFLLLERRRDLRKVPHFLLANLSAVGLLSSIIVMPIVISIAARTYFMKQQDGIALTVLCKIRLVLSFFCSTVNAITLSLMAMDRHDCICRPLRRRLHPDNVKKVLLIVWLMATIMFVVFAILLSVDESQCPQYDPFNLRSRSSTSSGFFNAYITIFGTVFNVSAILIIMVTFICVVRGLRSSPLPQSRSLHRRYESQITKLTYKTGAIFILSWFPVIISHSTARFSAPGSEGILSLKLLTTAFTGFAYASNPILHYKMLKTTSPTLIMSAVVTTQTSAEARDDGTRSTFTADHSDAFYMESKL